MDRLCASARLMIVSDLDHTMDPSATTVHPFGVEKTPHENIHELKGWYGDKQRKMFWAWVDHVLSTQLGSSTWLVMRDAVVQSLERSVLRRAMVHMGSPGCMYNRRGRKD